MTELELQMKEEELNQKEEQLQNIQDAIANAQLLPSGSEGTSSIIVVNTAPVEETSDINPLVIGGIVVAAVVVVSVQMFGRVLFKKFKEKRYGTDMSKYID